MSTGNIVQVIGAVIDVEFPRNAVPAVYDALIVADQSLTLEVQQQLGDGVVRAIAMGTSDGVKRGMVATNTGAPISVPVGAGTLGRVMNVLGEAIDNAGDIVHDKKMPIHRAPPAYDELSSGIDILASRLST